jgi:hypothetical protein
MLNPRLMVILSGLPDGDAALSMVLEALAQAGRPYDLRFVLPERYADAVTAALRALPAGALNAGDVKFRSEAGGPAGAASLVTDETHFLSLTGGYAFGPRWDAALFSRFAKIQAKKALMTAVIRGEGDGAQAYLPAFRGEIGGDTAPLGTGLALVCGAAPVKTLLVHPAFVFGNVRFLREATLEAGTLSIAAYAAGYAVYALDRAPLWPAGGRQDSAVLARPSPDSLPSTSLRRFEQLAGLSFSAHTATVRAENGVFGVEDAYPQRMPPRLELSQRVRTLFRSRAAALPLTVTAFIDLPDVVRPTADYLLRFSYLKALAGLPLTLFTGGEAERQLRARFPNTLAYPDNALLPRALLADGITPTQLFRRNKLLLLERASHAYPSYAHLAWLDLDALSHPVCPQATPDCAALTDGRVHLGWVNGEPDTSFLVAPRELLRTLVKETQIATQLDTDLKRSYSERQLYRSLLSRYPGMFTLHPMPRRELLFPSRFPPELLAAPLREALATPLAPMSVGDALLSLTPGGGAAPEKKEEVSDA